MSRSSGEVFVWVQVHRWSGVHKTHPVENVLDFIALPGFNAAMVVSYALPHPPCFLRIRNVPKFWKAPAFWLRDHRRTSSHEVIEQLFLTF